MGMITWIKNVLGIETDEVETGSEAAASAASAAAAAPAPPAPPAPAPTALPMDEEEKNLVAVVASCIAGSGKADAQLHIQRITRIE